MKSSNYCVASVLVLSLFTGATTAAIAATNSNKSGTNKPTDIFFTQTASHATLNAIPGKTSTYTLTLHDVNPHTVWFTSRPNRRSGDISVANFTKIWALPGTNSLSQVNPNANLIGYQNSNGVKNPIHDVFTISHPNYDAKQNTLSYTAYSIHNHNFDQNLTLQQVTLLVDSIYESCWGCPW